MRLGVEHVLRQANINRPHRRGAGDLEGSAKHTQQRGGVLHHRCPLGHRCRHANEIGSHLRVHCSVANAGVAADHHERAVAAFRLIEGANRVAEAGRGMDLGYRDLAGRPGMGIRGKDRD